VTPNGFDLLQQSLKCPMMSSCISQGTLNARESTGALLGSVRFI